MRAFLPFFLISLCGLAHSEPKPVTEHPGYTKLSDDEVNHLLHRGFGPTVPTFDEYEYADTHTAASQQRSTYAEPENSPYVYQNAIPIRAKVQSRGQTPQAPRPTQNYPQQFRPTPTPEEVRNKLKEEEEEIEEPDRLSLLLPNSKFACQERKTGYYADEELGCEVFHYCQENIKHSWICPEGFTFHQIHLICMPPGNDNICEKSSQYHFVNEYLYKPLNLEEYQQKPNVSLRYSDRYYPEHYYDEEEERVNQHRNSIRVVDAPVQRTTFRPETNLGQVFRSPNEVNIPLQHRRPQYLAPRYVADDN